MVSAPGSLPGAPTTRLSQKPIRPWVMGRVLGRHLSPPPAGTRRKWRHISIARAMMGSARQQLDLLCPMAPPPALFLNVWVAVEAPGWPLLWSQTRYPVFPAASARHPSPVCPCAWQPVFCVLAPSILGLWVRLLPVEAGLAGVVGHLQLCPHSAVHMAATPCLLAALMARLLCRPPWAF